MKILNYLKQLEKKENEKLEKARKASILSKDIRYNFINSIRNLESEGGNILKLSKKAINNLTNGDGVKAGGYLIEALKKIKSFDENVLELKKEFEIKRPSIEQADVQEIKIDILENDFLSAKEEYLEAKILFSYLKNGLIYKPRESLLKDFKSYAGALSDFCGELLRKARLDIIEKQYSKKEIKKYYQDIKDIYQILSNFSFSNKSGVRHKMEQLKDYIKGFEDILFNLKDT